MFTVFADAISYCRKRISQNYFFDVPAEEDPEVHLGQLKKFSLHELRVATDDFSNKNILRKDGFGNKVYKGRLTDGFGVEVKRFKEESVQQGSGELQFQREVENISLAVDRNLLRLLGFCITPTERLLVYPFMANGSLASCLQDRPESKPPLEWPVRKQIALGVARGLAYLHDHCDPNIIHGDVNAANILLDEEYKAFVGDLGLAKLMEYKDAHVTTIMSGIVAPEYVSTGKSSEKTDAFGYGVMLLELIAGKRAFDLAQLTKRDHAMLIDWVIGLLKDKRLKTLVDADLGGEYDEEEVEQLIQVALTCTQKSAMGRPKMSEVVWMLESYGLVEIWDQLPKEEICLSAFDTAGWIVDSDSDIFPEELSSPR